MTIGYTNILERGSRLKKLLTFSATALVMSVAAASPSWAAVNGADRNLEVDYSLDFVLLEGYPANQDIQVDVIRNGVTIGTFTGQPTAGAGGDPSTLEINHVGGGQFPNGDCWSGPATPDILPGDKVQATVSATDVDYTFVRDLTFAENADGTLTGRALGNEVGGTFEMTPLVLADPGGEAATGDFLEGKRVAATVDRIFVFSPQADGGYDAATGNFTSTVLPGGAGAGDVTMQYVKESAGVNSVESTVAGPTGTVGGPATPECPDLAQTAITNVSQDVINTTTVNSPLLINGVAADGITNVNVALGGTNYPATVSGGTWQASVPATALAALPQGPSDIVATFTGAGAPNPQTVTIQKDTVRPGLATSNVPPGAYNTNQSVLLGSPEGNAEVRYTTDGTNPTATNGILYDGQPINVTSSQTFKAVVIDAAGNPGEVATFEYIIDMLAPGLSASLNTGSFDSAQMLSFTSDEPGPIFYTTNGSTPNRSSNPYTGPIRIASTQTVRAIAYDAAGNSSTVQRTITIRTASTTTLNVPTTNLKLGQSRTIAGGVSPNNAGGFVRVTIDRPGTLSTINRNVSLSAFSRFTTVYRPTAVGTYRITASFAKDADNLGSTSLVKSFRVIR